MTEEEAKTKWCPMVRFNAEPGFPAFNRNGTSMEYSPDFCCIGSACMMWESWEYEDGNVMIRKGEGDCGLKHKPDSIGWRNYDTSADEPALAQLGVDTGLIPKQAK